MEFIQDPFTVYKDYCAIKLHFTSPTYNFIQYKGKIRASERSFRERRDKPFFNYLATVLNRSDNAPFFVSQFIENPCWIGDIIFEKEESMRRYTAWTNRIESLKDNYLIDLHNIAAQGHTWKTILGYSLNTHPPLFKLVTQKKITPETYVLLDKLSSFISKTISVYKDDTLYSELNMKYLKYGYFIDISQEKILQITPKDLTSVC